MESSTPITCETVFGLEKTFCEFNVSPFIVFGTMRFFPKTFENVQNFGFLMFGIRKKAVFQCYRYPSGIFVNVNLILKVHDRVF